MNELKFGQGNISVTVCTRNCLPVVVLENGNGVGEIVPVGKDNAPKNRRVGQILTEEEFENASCVMSFENVESLDVLIGALQVIKEECFTPKEKNE